MLLRICCGQGLVGQISCSVGASGHVGALMDEQPSRDRCLSCVLGVVLAPPFLTHLLQGDSPLRSPTHSFLTSLHILLPTGMLGAGWPLPLVRKLSLDEQELCIYLSDLLNSERAVTEGP